MVAPPEAPRNVGRSEGRAAERDGRSAAQGHYREPHGRWGLDGGQRHCKGRGYPNWLQRGTPTRQMLAANGRDTPKETPAQ